MKITSKLKNRIIAFRCSDEERLSLIKACEKSNIATCSDYLKAAINAFADEKIFSVKNQVSNND